MSDETPDPVAEAIGSLPEGVGRNDVRAHAVTLELTTRLINATGAYLAAEGGSAAERKAEDYLNLMLESIGEKPLVSGSVLMTLTSLIVGTAKEADVEAWFADQALHIAEVLRG